jgi:hypothetical protein
MIDTLHANKMPHLSCYYEPMFKLPNYMHMGPKKYGHCPNVWDEDACVVCACPCPLSCCLPVAPPPRPSTSRRLLIVDSIVNDVVVATTAAALDRLRPPLQPKTIALRWTTGSNCCCPQPLPFLPGRRSEGRSVRQRPSIVSVAAMVAGGDDGLP